MKKRIINIVQIICIIIALLIQLSTLSLAASAYIPTPGDGGGAGGSIAAAGGTILSVILAIGASVATVILVWLAIKYITAAPDEKANIKKSAVTYLIGAVILFGFAGVLNFVASVSGNIGGALGGGAGGGIDAVSGADGSAQ